MVQFVHDCWLGSAGPTGELLHIHRRQTHGLHPRMSPFCPTQKVARAHSDHTVAHLASLDLALSLAVGSAGRLAILHAILAPSLAIGSAGRLAACSSLESHLLAQRCPIVRPCSLSSRTWHGLGRLAPLYPGHLARERSFPLAPRRCLGARVGASPEASYCCSDGCEP